MKTMLRIAAMMMVCVMAAWPQFLPPLEADSPEEFDDYLSVESAGDPKATLKAATAFVAGWPKSAMLPRIYELEFSAWRRLGDVAKAREAAQAALRSVPGNLTVKSELAVLLAASDPPEAERLAGETLSELDTFRVPRRIAPDRWSRIAGTLRLQAHMALGMVRFARGDDTGAIGELEKAEQAAPAVDPALCLRLGRLYAAKGRAADARRQFERAIGTGDPVAMRLAQKELLKLP